MQPRALADSMLVICHKRAANCEQAQRASGNRAVCSRDAWRHEEPPPIHSASPRISTSSNSGCRRHRNVGEVAVQRRRRCRDAVLGGNRPRLLPWASTTHPACGGCSTRTGQMSRVSCVRRTRCGSRRPDLSVVSGSTGRPLRLRCVARAPGQGRSCPTRSARTRGSGVVRQGVGSRGWVQ